MPDFFVLPDSIYEVIFDCDGKKWRKLGFDCDLY